METITSLTPSITAYVAFSRWLHERMLRQSIWNPFVKSSDDKFQFKWEFSGVINIFHPELNPYRIRMDFRVITMKQAVLEHFSGITYTRLIQITVSQ